jgi:hypothetical protein
MRNVVSTAKATDPVPNILSLGYFDGIVVKTPSQPAQAQRIIFVHILLERWINPDVNSPY